MHNVVCLLSDWQISSSHAYRSLEQMAGSTSCSRTTILVGILLLNIVQEHGKRRMADFTVIPNKR